MRQWANRRIVTEQRVYNLILFVSLFAYIFHGIFKTYRIFLKLCWMPITIYRQCTSHPYQLLSSSFSPNIIWSILYHQTMLYLMFANLIHHHEMWLSTRGGTKELITKSNLTRDGVRSGQWGTDLQQFTRFLANVACYLLFRLSSCH